MSFVLTFDRFWKVQFLNRAFRFRRNFTRGMALTLNLFFHTAANLDDANGTIERQRSSSTRISIPALADKTVISTNLAIVFIHKSWSDYLKYSLAQARSFNPNSPIYLLGDAANDRFDFVDHQPISKYLEEATEFAKVYRHFSTNPYNFELFNFQRWLILKNFLASNRIEKCLYLDSDTLLYTAVTEDSAKFAQFDFTVSHQNSGNTFFLNRVEGLNDFCCFLFDLYTKKDKYHYDKMLAHYAVRRRHGFTGGVCDMTAIKYYRETHFGQSREVAEVIDGSVYDPNITLTAPGFEMENGIKKLTLKDGIPYGIHIRTAKEIKFNSLHFQGWETKKLMERFYTGRVLVQT